jgi:hypothetical protein
MPIRVQGHRPGVTKRGHRLEIGPVEDERLADGLTGDKKMGCIGQ